MSATAGSAPGFLRKPREPIQLRHVPVDVTTGIVQLSADPTHKHPAEFVKGVAASVTRRTMKVRPDNRWVRAVPTDNDMLPLPCVLDGQIRRDEHQAKQ